jgi:hypothetical protein
VCVIVLWCAVVDCEGAVGEGAVGGGGGADVF